MFGPQQERALRHCAHCATAATALVTLLQREGQAQPGAQGARHKRSTPRKTFFLLLQEAVRSSPVVEEALGPAACFEIADCVFSLIKLVLTTFALVSSGRCALALCGRKQGPCCPRLLSECAVLKVFLRSNRHIARTPNAQRGGHLHQQRAGA